MNRSIALPVLALLTASAVHGGVAHAARALDEGSVLVTGPTWSSAQQRSARAFGQRSSAFDFPFAEGRLELAAQGTLAGEAELTQAIGVLDSIALTDEQLFAAKPRADVRARRAAAAKLLGPGKVLVRHQRSERTPLTTVKTDDADGTLARTGAELSLTESYGTTMLNFAPPPGARFANGVAVRATHSFDLKGAKLVERGGRFEVDLDDRALTFLSSSSDLNPLREIHSIYPELFPRSGPRGKMTAADRVLWKASLTRLLTPRVAMQKEKVRYSVADAKKVSAEVVALRVTSRNAQDLAAPPVIEHRIGIEDGGELGLELPEGTHAANHPTYRSVVDAVKHRKTPGGAWARSVKPAKLDLPIPADELDELRHRGVIAWPGRTRTSVANTRHPALVRFTTRGTPTATGLQPDAQFIHSLVAQISGLVPGLRMTQESSFTASARALHVTPTGRPEVRLGSRLYPKTPPRWRSLEGRVPLARESAPRRVTTR